MFWDVARTSVLNKSFYPVTDEVGALVKSYVNKGSKETQSNLRSKNWNIEIWYIFLNRVSKLDVDEGCFPIP